VSELRPSSCHDFRDGGRVRLASEQGIRWKRHLGFLIVLVDANLHDRQQRTSFPLTLRDAPFHLCPDPW
jgi:hypothetical protein